MAFAFKLSFGNKKKKSDKKEPAPTPTQAVTINEQPLEGDEFERRCGDIVRKVFLEENQKWAFGKDGEMPMVAPGRSSLYEGFRNYMPNSNTPVPTDFNFSTLRYLAKLSMWNRHVSQAVDNIVTFGNTDYTVDFGKTVNQKLTADLRKYLWSECENWYEFADGEDALDNDLLAQLAVYGTLSAEGVIKSDMRGIQNIVRVDPYFVRFAYDQDKNKHVPLQEVGGLHNLKGAISKYPGYIELNTNTYNYIAMRRMGEMPYAIPPFVSALEDIFIQNDMIKNFQNMMRRLGMLGFLSVLVKTPVSLPGETEQAYQSRLEAYLNRIRTPIEKGFHKGMTIGFQGTHEFELQGTDLNAGNAESLMKITKSLVLAGVKQDPNMHGENYATTETFGRVILEKMTAQVINYQKPVARFRSRMFKLALLLKGFKAPEVNVKYNRPTTHDEKREQEVLGLKILNANLLYQNGTIDQVQRANLLGYDEPAEKEPLETDAEKIAKLKPAAGGTAKKKNSLDRIKKKLKSDLPIFDYTVPEGVQQIDFVDVGDFPDQKMVRFLEKYIGKVNSQFNKAIIRARKDIRRQFDLLQEGATFNQVYAAFQIGLIYNWDNNFAIPVEQTVENNIEPIYSHYRKDKSIFEDAEEFSRQSFFTIPDALFDLVDARAIQFLETIDKVYLGKFITDPDTEKRIISWLKQKFEAGDVPIGKGSRLIDDFIRDFGDLVKLEAWKIRRVVETTANRTRNIGNLYYMNQAQIVEFEVVEVMDDRTCGWCRHMNRKRFSVKYSAEKFDSLFRSGIEQLPKASPFATKFKLDEFVKMDAKAIQANGIDIPSYHCHCRGRIVAHFKN